MIHRLGSDLASFKTLTFNPGLNVLLADKSEGASDRQSRNGAGKTSFVELLHFLFGGRVDPKSIFRSDALHSWTFDALVDVGPQTVSVARSGERPSAVRTSRHDLSSFNQIDLAPILGHDVLRNEDWTHVLGNEWFSLPVGREDRRFKPTFRSLFSLFAHGGTSAVDLRALRNTRPCSVYGIDRCRHPTYSGWIGRYPVDSRNFGKKKSR